MMSIGQFAITTTQPDTMNQALQKLFSSSTNSSKSRKIVSFCTQVTMTETLHHVDYTSEEKQDCWYTLKDIAQMKEDNTRTVKIFRERGQDNTSNDDDCCCRGLEHRIIPNYGRKHTRDTARAMVITEQRRQLKAKKKNPLEIAQRYKSISSSCEIKAYQNGLMDAIQANVPSSEAMKQLDDVTREVMKTFDKMNISSGSSNSNIAAKTGNKAGVRDVFSRFNQMTFMNKNSPSSKRKQLLQRNACAA